MASRPLSSLGLPPSTLSALTRAGYETLRDLQSTSVEGLAQDLKITLPASESIFGLSQKPSTPSLTFPHTQSAASMITSRQKVSTKSSAADTLLQGGIPRGHILEISGPPGTPKEALAVNIAASFVEAGEEVIFIDSQNMVCPTQLAESFRNRHNLPSNYSRHIYHVKAQTLPDLMSLIHNLPTILDSHPKAGLLVLSSISFHFQGGQSLSVQAKNALLEKIKQALTKAAVSRNLTLATKILNADGSPGTFNTGAKGIMVPQLGTSYLPKGRTHRIIIVPESKGSGFIKLLSSPTYQGRGPAPRASYRMTWNGQIL